MKLGVIIVTYNRLELLKECIEACINQTYKFSKILIINNASTDGTDKFLNEITYDNIEIINSDENLGGAGGFYLGVKNIKECDLDYILLIDDDAIIDENYNEEIVKNIEKNNNSILAYSGTVKTNNQIQYEHRQHLHKNFEVSNSLQKEYENEFFDYELASFCGLYVSMDLINKIGLPRKDFFIWFDDTEYSLRINKFSKIRNVNNAWLNHKTTISKTSGYNWKSYYGLRNTVVILKEYYSKIALLKTIMKMKLMSISAIIIKILKQDNYYKEVSNIYKDSLRDGLEGNLGKNKKYIPGFILKKK